MLACGALLLSGVAIGMNIWSLAFALKWLVWKQRQNTAHGSDNTGHEGEKGDYSCN